MSTKIPSDPKAVNPTDAVADVGESIESTVEAAESAEVQPAASDPISRIASQVAAGEIGQDQAIDLILSQVLNSPMVKTAPKEVLGELEKILRTALDTDPELKSLRAVLGTLDTD